MRCAGSGLIFTLDLSVGHSCMMYSINNMQIACLQWAGMAPTIRGTWGHGIQIVRLNMYLHTTPAMVYLLSIVSDFSRTKVRPM